MAAGSESGAGRWPRGQPRRRGLGPPKGDRAHARDDENVRAGRLAVAAGAHFVKTSTGYAPGGATVEDVMLMRRTVGPAIGVKASGGIRDTDMAMRMVQA